MRIDRLLLLGIGVPALLSACATSKPAPAGDIAARPPPGSAEEATLEMMESTRRSARFTAEWLARGVDSWFGDKPFSEGGKVTDGRLSLGLYKRQDEKLDVSLRFNARFRLPNLERATYLFIGRDNEREVVTDKPGALSRQDRLLTESVEDRSFFAGLGRAVNDAVDFRLGVRGGLKPYAQARYRRPWELANGDLVEFRETVFWTIKDNLGSTTALSYERALSPTLVTRWLGATTITQKVRRFEWSTSLGAYKSFGGQRLLSFEALASGADGSGVGISDYGLQTKWEQPLQRDWLLGEVLVGHFWPRRDANVERGRAWAIGGRLKMRF